MTGGAKSPLLPALLVVEDDDGLARQLRWSYEAYDVTIAGSRAAAIEALIRIDPAVVTLDLGLPPDPDGTSEGFATLVEILRLRPDTKVIVASGHGARESALKAIELGAWDFYQKPVNFDELGLMVRRAFHVATLEVENRRLKDETGHKAFGTIVTGAPAMIKVCQMVERVARADVSVLLLGASGTGKELLARGLHASSPRAAKPFIAINCAAIPETLLEAELFGYEKGAFTGAAKTTEGKIELAQNGTLFLDEVGDIPLPLQVKLLRFLQERVIERIGGRREIPVNVRIVSATHRNLTTMIADGGFREDLYYRLAEISVAIPSLIERDGDAVLLAQLFAKTFAKEHNPIVKGIAPDALDVIGAHAWPGNVRELENRIKRAVIMADGPRITAVDLDIATDATANDTALNLKQVREDADKRAIRIAMARSEGNITQAAKVLGISRPTMYDLLKQYNMHEG